MNLLLYARGNTVSLRMGGGSKTTGGKDISEQRGGNNGSRGGCGSLRKLGWGLKRPLVAAKVNADGL